MMFDNTSHCCINFTGFCLAYKFLVISVHQVLLQPNLVSDIAFMFSMYLVLVIMLF
jgi:hypothetical protein